MYVHMCVYSFIPRPQMVHGFTMWGKKKVNKRLNDRLDLFYV